MSGKSFVRPGPSGYEHYEVFCSDTIRRRGNTTSYKVECRVRSAALSFPSSRDTCSHFLQPCGTVEPGAGDLDWWAPPAPVQPKMVTLFPFPSTDAPSFPFSRLFIVSVHGRRSHPPLSLSLSLSPSLSLSLFTHAHCLVSLLSQRPNRSHRSSFPIEVCSPSVSVG